MPAGFAMMGICTHRLQEYSGDGPPHRCVSRGCPCHCTRTIGNHFRSTSRVLPPSRLLETVHAATTMTAWLPDPKLSVYCSWNRLVKEEMLSNRSFNIAVWDVLGIIRCPRNGIFFHRDGIFFPFSRSARLPLRRLGFPHTQGVSH